MKIIRILLLIVILQSCFPIFRPEVRVKKEIKQGEVIIKWVEVIGILDQNFPDIITIQKNKQIDTICKSHNIADVNIIVNTIKMGFFGTPEIWYEPITLPMEIMGYKIEIDTSFITNSKIYY